MAEPLIHADDLATGKAGLRTALRKVEQLLRDGRDATLKESAEFEPGISRTHSPAKKTAGAFPAGCLDALALKLQSELDEKAGRVRPAQISHAARAGSVPGSTAAPTTSKNLHVCTSTLTALLQSGMYDHLAGGFHRCCVTAGRIPRFEKC